RHQDGAPARRLQRAAQRHGPPRPPRPPGGSRQRQELHPQRSRPVHRRSQRGRAERRRLGDLQPGGQGRVAPAPPGLLHGGELRDPVRLADSSTSRNQEVSLTNGVPRDPGPKSFFTSSTPSSFFGLRKRPTPNRRLAQI